MSKMTSGGIIKKDRNMIVYMMASGCIIKKDRYKLAYKIASRY